ncbi:hypothetical protein EDC94DRAFT_489435, partial [Helicostylum pulchrum]
VVSITIKELQRSLHKDYDAISDQPRPPMRITLRLLLRPFFWKMFWSLPMTAKAFAPWWRVLQDCMGAKLKLHAWSPTAFLSPSCTIHTMDFSEDLFHMIVGCDHKWNYRSDIFVLLSLQSRFPEKLSVWAVLTCLSSTTGAPGSNKMKPLPNDILIILGTAYSTIWKYYWFGVISD